MLIKVEIEICSKFLRDPKGKEKQQNYIFRKVKVAVRES